MNYLSVCSGIEAATVAWHDLGWNPVGFSEIEKFPSQVLAHHYPNVTNFGDMTKFKEWNINEPVDLIVGGTPCQSFSIAGLRKGLDDPRGNLMLTYLAMAEHFKAKWLLWENVPGVLSSNGGRDFATLLQGLAELGYGFAYRVLDAQHFGVPQRRRRVFLVGCLGDWKSAAKVLFESESLCRDITPRREERESTTTIAIPSVAGSLDTECGGTKLTHQSANAGHIFAVNAESYTPSSFGGYKEGFGTLRAAGGDLGGGSESLIATFDRQSNSEYGDAKVASTVNARDWKGPTDLVTVYETHPADSRVKEMGDVCQTVTSRWGTGGGNVPIAIDVRNGKVESDGPTMTLQSGGIGEGRGMCINAIPHALTVSTNPEQQIVTHAFKVRGGCEGGGKGYLGSDEVAFTLSTNQDQQLCTNMRVRRLTPLECERLQGFPDNYTNIPNAPDSGRYKALGNSMAVPCMRWIGERIQAVESGK